MLFFRFQSLLLGQVLVIVLILKPADCKDFCCLQHCIDFEHFEFLHLQGLVLQWRHFYILLR